MCEEPTTRAGFAAIVGRPNVGKSTLLNALLGEKIAIVSPRPQTTRNRILGVRTDGPAQVVLVDTPGIHHARDNINRFMVREALAAIDGVDCIVLVAEVQRASAADGQQPEPRLHQDDRYALQQVQHLAPKAPLIVAINKIDLLRDRRWLLPMIDSWRSAGFSRIVPISGLKESGLDALLSEVQSLMPAGPHLYPEDMLTDRAERFLVAELIREQVFRQLRQEVPYATAIELNQFNERPDRKDICIDATIYVEREGQKAIIIGHQGQRIKQVGIGARKAIAALLHCDVHLNLLVAVAEDWTQRTAGRRRFGYE